MGGAGIRGARRPLWRKRPRFIRRAGQPYRLWLTVVAALVWPITGHAQEVVSAEYIQPTTRYGHAVLGDGVEYGALRLWVREQSGQSRLAEVTVTLPQDHVFEDLRPRLVDVDLDGRAEVMVVEIDMARGAQLAIYDAAGAKIAATPHIGQTHRWLAPIGAADLDGDGFVELAYIDRPHLAKTLRVWRYRPDKPGRLEEVAQLSGLTNHRIGQDFITSGLRDCGTGPEIITANATWQQIVATRLVNGQLISKVLGPFARDENLSKTLACKD